VGSERSEGVANEWFAEHCRSRHRPKASLTRMTLFIRCAEKTKYTANREERETERERERERETERKREIEKERKRERKRGKERKREH